MFCECLEHRRRAALTQIFHTHQVSCNYKIRVTVARAKPSNFWQAVIEIVPPQNAIVKLFAENRISANSFPSLTCLLRIYCALACIPCEAERSVQFVALKIISDRP